MSIREQTVEGFLTAIASETIAPAGGSAVATTGAIGASLCEMAVIHLAAAAEAAADPPESRSAVDRLTEHRDDLLRLADEDARVVERLYADSADDVSETDVKSAVGVPMTIAEVCLDVLETVDRSIERWDRAVAADAQTGLLLTSAALRAALFIVDQNLELVSDRTFGEETRERVAEIMEAIAGIESIPPQFEPGFTSD